MRKLLLIPLLFLAGCTVSLPTVLTDINLALTAAVPILAAFGGPAAQAAEVSVYFAQAANAVVACSSTQSGKLIDVSTCIAIVTAVLDSTPKIQGDPQLQKQIDTVSAELQLLLKQLGAPQPVPVTGAVRPRAKVRVMVKPIEIKPADAYKLEQVRTKAVELRDKFTNIKPKDSSLYFNLRNASGFAVDMQLAVNSRHPEILDITVVTNEGPQPFHHTRVGLIPTMHIIEDKSVGEK